MKRFLLIFLAGALSFFVFGCTKEETTTTNTSVSTTTTTTTSSPSVTTTTWDPFSLMANIPEECQGVEVVSGWVPVWCEEFNGTGAPDSAKWSFQTGGGGYGNNELQYYTSRSENAYVSDGKLVITAIKESYMGSSYTSAKIWTQGKANFKYGKFEMRAKLPYSEGTWPAFWMMPKLSVYGGWPNSGEIDIMEHVGNNLNTVVGTIHTEKYNHSIGTQISFSKYLAGLSEDFHTYSVTWNEYSMSWYVDSFKYGTTVFDAGANTDVEAHAAWPFDQEFYLILNLAMGGNMGGTIDPNFTSDTYEIDYVRVFQRDYATNDTVNPTPVTGLTAVKAVDTEAYLIWTKSSDNNSYTGYGQVMGYNLYVDGVFLASTSLNTFHLTNLVLGQDYYVEVEAFDYGGNVSSKTAIHVQTQSQE